MMKIQRKDAERVKDCRITSKRYKKNLNAVSLCTFAPLRLCVRFYDTVIRGRVTEQPAPPNINQWFYSDEYF
jgi:hypothetical protein